jgi:hypothetical protein
MGREVKLKDLSVGGRPGHANRGGELSAEFVAQPLSMVAILASRRYAQNAAFSKNLFIINSSL